MFNYLGAYKMRVKEMHPLCCISLESPAIGDQSPEPKNVKLSRSCSDTTNVGSETCSRSFAGVVQKWTNYGKGWRWRWFLLRNGVISYSKILRPETLAAGEDIRFIGDSYKRLDRCGSSRCHKHHKSIGIVYLKVIC